MTRLQTLIKEVLSQPKKKDCNCGCNNCGGKAPILTEGKVKHLISEGLQYHMDKKIQLHESVYRIGSEKHFELIREARALWVRGIIDVSEDDQAILETHLGNFGMYEGEAVPLDMPMVNEEAKMPSQEEVDKFFSITQNEMHYLNSKPVMGQKGDRVRREIEPWDEYDLSNWNALVRKAKAQGKINEDMNDPVLVKTRAAKMAAEKEKAKQAALDKKYGSSYNDKLFAEIDLKQELQDLKDEREQLMIDMEQEAEPEGGEIADRYGSRLNDIDTRMAEIKSELDDLRMYESLNEDEATFEYNKARAGRIMKDLFGLDFEFDYTYKLEGDRIIIHPEGYNPDGTLFDMKDVHKEKIIRTFQNKMPKAKAQPNMGGGITVHLRGFSLNEDYDPDQEQLDDEDEIFMPMDDEGRPLEEKKKAKPKKKDPPIGKPKRGGPKAYYVYVRDPKTKRIKKVTFGSGGLKAKIRNPKARKAFAARHRCKTANDRTTARYWSCRLPRYAKQLGLGSNMNTFW